MSSDSFRYLDSKSRSIAKNWKFLALFGLALLTLLPAAMQSPARISTPSNISPRGAVSVSPSVAQDFSITANPSSITTTPGSTKTVQLTITGIGGFTGQVYMSASSFSFPQFPVDLNPPIVSLSSGTATSTLTITVPNNASPGSNTVFVDSTGGCTLFHFLDISVNVNAPDFAITSEKVQATLSPGGSDTAKIDLTSVDSFSGTVSLFSFSQFTTSLSPTSVTLTPSGTSSSTFTVTAPITIAPGNYTVGVDGSSGSIFHSTDILVTVTGPDIALSASRYFLTLIAGGASNSSTISVTALGGFTGQVTLAASPPTPLTPTLSASTVNIPPTGSSTLTVNAPSGTKAQIYSIDITGTSGSLQGSTSVEVQVKQPDFEISADPSFIAVVAGGSSCTSTVTLSSVLGFSANVGLVLTGSSSVTSTLSASSVSVPGTSTLTISAPSGAVPGFYSIEVNGTSLSPARTHSAFVDVLVIGPDFTLSANPDPVTIMAGSSGTSTISLTPILGFSSTVSLTTSTSDPGLTPTLSSSSITSPSTSTLTVAVASGTVPANYYTVQVNGTSGQLTHSIYITIQVTGPGFFITANPSSLTLNSGGSTTSTITITPTNGFSSSVDLFASPSSANLNASILPTTVTSGSYSATLSVNSTIPGSYSVDIFGSGTTSTGGFLSNDTIVDVTVVGPDFTLSASPPSLTITGGGSQTSTVTLGSLGGFNTPVDLTATAPAGLTPTFATTSVTPPGTSVLTVAVDPSMTPGTYTVDIQAKGGAITHTTQLTVNVVGFTLAVNPDTLTILQGTSQTSTITVTPLNGFAGTVQLSASLPTGLSGTPNPTSIAGGSGTSQLSITAASSIAPGTYLVNVTGVSGSLTQTATITVTVPPPDFDLSPSTPTTVSCTLGNACPTTLTVTPVNGFTGTVSFTASPSTGLLCDPITSVTIPTSMQTSLSCHSITTGSFTVTVTATSGTLSHTTGVITYNVAQAPDFAISASPVAPSTILAGASGTSTITVTTVGGFSGLVSFQVSTSTPAGLTCNTPAASGQTSTLTCSASSAADYTVTVSGTATISGSSVTRNTGSIVFHIVDFGISAGAVTPSPVLAKSPASSTITITDLNSFSGTVTFTVSASSPSGLTCTAPGSVSGTTLTSTLSCNSSNPGDYTVTVTGTSSILSHSTASIIFHVSGFTVAATSPAAANTGQTTTSTITITPVNGFTGSVQLSDTPLPTGLICSPISPTSVTIASAAATANLACYSTQDGTFTVTITGTGSSLNTPATASFTFHTPDITIASTTPASTTTAQSTTSTITVSPTNGFTGTVTLAVSAPSGITCTLDHATLQGSGTALLTCTSNTPNDYTVTVTATGGTSPHSTTQTFHVSAVPSPAAPAPTIIGLAPLLFYAIIGVLIVAVIGGVIVVIRRK